MKFIDSRTILVEQTPQIAMYPDKPEPPRPEIKWLDKPALIKKLRWKDEHFDAAQGYDFPVASKRTRWGSIAITLVWREDHVDRWVTRMREKVAAMEELVGQ